MIRRGRGDKIRKREESELRERKKGERAKKK